MEWAVPIFILGVVAFVLVVSFINTHRSVSSDAPWEYADIYRKKAFLMDHGSEYKLFQTLNELFGEHYLVIPQVHLSHLVEVRPMEYKDYMRYWSKVNKKSLDFVLCDKQYVVPRLGIELDGSSHSRPDRIERDKFVDQLMRHIGLPMVRIKRDKPLDREGLRLAIQCALAGHYIPQTQTTPAPSQA